MLVWRGGGGRIECGEVIQYCCISWFLLVWYTNLRHCGKGLSFSISFSKDGICEGVGKMKKELVR